MAATDKVVAGSIPALYQRHLAPLLFGPYAEDLAAHLADMAAGRVLETAAGTGVLTRTLLAHLPEAVEVVATDLNAAMLEHAGTLPASRAVERRQADACALPFSAATFDAVACQFGVMFFPEKQKGFAQAARGLRQGGRFVFNAWDSLAANDFARVVTEAVAALFPGDPPSFLARTPHGHHDAAVIEAGLRRAGFARLEVEAVEGTSRAPSARDPAIGFCQGTPLRAEIEARDPAGLERATAAAAAALEHRFGPGPIEGCMRAYVFSASR
ncbi:MAG: methyltransferase domain-containing protein [Rhodospirillaceae bacterium]|nr:methyltransferase domain-containing protein [Rhodospirillaceae bacterium]